MLSDTFGLDMAPKVPNKIYNRAAVIDDPVITLVGSTDGSFSNNQAGILITRAKLNKTTPSKESHDSPHQDNLKNKLKWGGCYYLCVCSIT